VRLPRLPVRMGCHVADATLGGLIRR
jgi:hypothetical protein